MAKLSVVISAYNEAYRIAACLRSVQFADEIILVNNSSTDTTVDIAKEYTKKIYTRKNNPMLNVNKNFGFTKASGDWILSLDADETISSELAQEIRRVINANSTAVAYWIPRKNIIFGKWIENSIWWPDYQLRLFKKGSGMFAEKHVHEMLDVTGTTEKLQEPMQHDNYTSISQYLYKLDKIYTTSEAEALIRKGRKVTWVDAIQFPINDFLKTFFAQKGYKDGLHGLVLSLLQAFYAEIVFAKVWEKQGFDQYNDKHFLRSVFTECKRISHEVDYWFLTSLIAETKNVVQKFAYKIARRNEKRKLQ